LTATEISAAIPKTGGMMIYIEEIYGEKLGFLTGWMQTVLFFPGVSIDQEHKNYNYFIKLDKEFKKLLSLGFIIDFILVFILVFT
ncbi:amino acid permease, partial [Clostridioides difficile]|uniref:amino acid permease n=1 Tax=Clostridioides difficile TaxID=1496 RepID=UPI003F8D42DA